MRVTYRSTGNTNHINNIDDFIETANSFHKYDVISYVKEAPGVVSNDKESIPRYKITMTCEMMSKVFQSVEDITFDQVERINAHNVIAKKKKSKDEAKKLVNKSFANGDILVLRGKCKDGSEKNEKIFEVKKVIWSLKGQIINALILKQLSGNNNNMSLTKKDCIKYHVKYEPNLQVYSMMLDFKKRKKYLNNLNLLLY